MQIPIPDKLSFVLFAWICAFLLPWQFNLPFIISLAVLASSWRPFRPITPSARKAFFRFLGYSTSFGVVLVIVNGLLLREGSIVFKAAIFDFYCGGFEYGLTVSVRLVLLSLSILVFFTSMRFQDFAEYLQSAGLPQSLVSIILLTLFFLEQLPNRITQVFTAQEARGAPVRAGMFARGRSFFLVLSPLVLSSIVESVERGIALELRGYYQRRQVKSTVHEEMANHVWLYVFLTLSLFVVIFSIVHWLSR